MLIYKYKTSDYIYLHSNDLGKSWNLFPDPTYNKLSWCDEIRRQFYFLCYKSPHLMDYRLNVRKSVESIRTKTCCINVLCKNTCLFSKKDSVVSYLVDSKCFIPGVNGIGWSMYFVIALLSRRILNQCLVGQLY